MAAALGWFGAIFEWLGRFLPRWILVRRGWKAIKWLPGGRVKLCGHGIHWYWPATTELMPYPVIRQVVRSKPQTLMTKDGKPVYCSGIVIFTIKDLVKFLVDNYETVDNLDDILQTAIRKAVISRNLAELQDGRVRIDHLLTREAQKSLRDFGVQVEAARLTDFSTARVLNVVGGALTTFNLSPNAQ